MAAAAGLTIAETAEPIAEPGELGPEEIITPGIYVDRVVHTGPVVAGDGLAWDGEAPR